MPELEIPLARCADDLIAQLARVTGSPAIASLDGRTLLGERAMLAGFAVPERISAGGGCRLFDAADDVIALNLSRRDDRALLPALFAVDDLDGNDDGAIAACIAACEAASLVARGRELGLAIAAEHEGIAVPTPCVALVSGTPAASQISRAPRVIDLSALWAGPLAAHLLWVAGAEVIKVESRTRPDSMREGDPTFFALLNQGKASVVLDLHDANDLGVLHSLIAAADIVIESARPRALAQLGIDAAELVRTTPGLTWITLTAHGARSEAANWVGFGDDCGVAGGLSAALRVASGRTGFVGDAIGDPLTGLWAALAAWRAWSSRRGGRVGLAMSHVIAQCLAEARARDAAGFEACLRSWSAAAGKPFPPVQRRPIGSLAALGEHTRPYLSQVKSC